MSQVAHVQGLCLNTHSPQGLTGDHGQRCQCFCWGKKGVLTYLSPEPHLRQLQLCWPSTVVCLSRACPGLLLPYPAWARLWTSLPASLPCA